MPYIVSRVAGQQNGSVQIHDLFINKTQKNLANDPSAQSPVHVRIPVWGAEFGKIPALATSGANVTFATSASGVLAYILRRVDDGAGDALTVGAAVGVTNGIKGIVEAGGAITLAVLNGLVPGDFDGAGVGSNSTGDVEELVRIISGESYNVPAGTAIQDAGGLIAVLADDYFASNVKRLVENDLSWRTSLQSGAIRAYVNNQTITLYEADGSLTAV